MLYKAWTGRLEGQVNIGKRLHCVSQKTKKMTCVGGRSSCFNSTARFGSFYKLNYTNSANTLLFLLIPPTAKLVLGGFLGRTYPRKVGSM